MERNLPGNNTQTVTEVLALDPFINWNWMRNNLNYSINCDGRISIIEESKEGDSDKDMPRAPTKASTTTSQTFPSLRNDNNSTKSCGEIDGVGINGEPKAGSDGKVTNTQENYEDEKGVERVYLLKERGQQTYAQPYSKSTSLT